MIVRALLHVHTSDDEKDYIPFHPEEVFIEARKQNINVVAFTCHDLFTPKEKYEALAKKYNILFISGIEKIIQKRDVVVLNCDETISSVHSFEELRTYKKNHPECFVFAPHPFFPSNYSLNEYLSQYIDCFDAIELSWFYTKTIDFNKKALAIAQHYNIPYIATPDAHRIEWLTAGYVEIETDEISESALFRAIKNHQFKNISHPKALWKLFLYHIEFTLSQIGKKKKSRKEISDS